MRVLKITSSYYPAFEFGGSVSADWILDNALVKNGVEIFVATTTAGQKNLKKSDLKVWKKINGINIIYFPFIGYKHYNFSFSYFWFLLWNLKKYDVVHFSGVWNFPVCIGAFLARLFKVRYIITTHGVFFANAFAQGMNLLKKIHYKLFVQTNLSKAKYVHFTTELEAKETMELLKIKINRLIIPYGLEYEKIQNVAFRCLQFRKKYNIDNKDKVILFVGRINPIKALDILFFAFEKIYNEVSNIKLLVVGPDTDGYKKKLLNMVSNSVKSNIIFTGMLQGNEKIDAYISSDVFVLPSYSENFGMTAVEAMMLELPIIISDNVGLVEMIRKYDAGMIIKYDVEELRKMIFNLINDDNLKNKFIKQGKKLFWNELEISKVALKFIEYYSKIV